MKGSDVKTILLFAFAAVILSLLLFTKTTKATPTPTPKAPAPITTLPVAQPKAPVVVTTTPPVATPASVYLRVLQPMYNPPQDQSFTDLKLAAQLYPERTIYAVVNPASGPISAEAAASAGYISTMTAIIEECPNVLFLCYCDTATGRNSVAQVEGLIETYLSWENGGVKLWHGAFLDDFDFVNVAYAQSLAAYCNANDLYGLGNPGTSLPTASYGGTLNGWVVYENPGLPSYQTVVNSQLGAKADFFFMAYGVTWGAPAIAAIAQIGPEIAGFYIGPGSATSAPYATPQTTAYLADCLEAIS